MLWWTPAPSSAILLFFKEMADSWTNPILYPPPEAPRLPKDLIPKLPLVLREEVKESTRSFGRKAPFGDMGGLSTPFLLLGVPDLFGDDKAGGIMVDD